MEDGASHLAGPRIGAKAIHVKWGRRANGLQEGFDHSLDEEREESEYSSEAAHREPAPSEHETSVQEGEGDRPRAQHDDDAHGYVLGACWPVPVAPPPWPVRARTS